MLRYNTQQRPLLLPEYGRNIQEMVDHCLTLDDRDERTRCAYTIVETMATIFPELKSGDSYSNKLWDHLAIMSNFKLDIDYPCEVIQSDSLHSRPESVGYMKGSGTHSSYGNVVLELIKTASAMDAGEERDALVIMIANQMKKIMICDNNDIVDDAKIFKDLANLSHGILRLNSEEIHLKQFVPVAAPTSKKKKKK